MRKESICTKREKRVFNMMWIVFNNLFVHLVNNLTQEENDTWTSKESCIK